MYILLNFILIPRVSRSGNERPWKDPGSSKSETIVELRMSSLLRVPKNTTMWACKVIEAEQSGGRGRGKMFDSFLCIHLTRRSYQLDDHRYSCMRRE